MFPSSKITECADARITRRSQTAVGIWNRCFCTLSYKCGSDVSEFGLHLNQRHTRGFQSLNPEHFYSDIWSTLTLCKTVSRRACPGSGPEFVVRDYRVL
jgi:hypothetical protein